MPYCDPFRQNMKRSIAYDFLNEFLYLSENKWFLGIGKISPWTTGGTDIYPPSNTDSVMNQTDFFRNLLASKLLTKDDISLVVPRYDWVGGTVYDSYRDDVDLFDDVNPAKFYALVDGERVYKCIDNNYNSPSTVPPTHTDAQIRRQSDGYRWKFLYQIPESKRKFLTKTYLGEGTALATITRQGYMPIEYVDFLRLNDDRTLQYSIQQSAVDGEIAFTLLKQNYRNLVVTDQNCLLNSANVVFVSVSSSGVTSVKISSPNIIPANDYTGMTLSIEEGPLAGTRRSIIGFEFDGDSNLGSFTIDGSYEGYDETGADENYDYPTSSGTRCRIVPTLEIIGDGEGGIEPPNPALGRADVRVVFGGTFSGLPTCGINIEGNYVSGFEMVDPGRNYTYADFKVLKGLTFINNLNLDLNDIGDPIMSPDGGHGSNAPLELGAAAVMIVKDFDGSERNTLTVDNDFRQVAIIKNPLLKNPLTTLYLDKAGASGSFPVGTTATQQTTEGYDPARGSVVEWYSGLASVTASSELTLNGITGGEFEYTAVVTSPFGITFGISEVHNRTKAGEEGKLLRRLEIVANEGQILTGTEYKRGTYVQGIGNPDLRATPSHSTGRVYSYSLQRGSNTKAYLLVEGTDLFNNNERISPCSYRLIPFGSAYRMTNQDETFVEGYSIYHSTVNLTLNAGSGSFGEDSFNPDSQFSSGSAEGVVVEWQTGASGTTGSIVLSGVVGSFVEGATASYTYNNQSFNATIDEIVREEDILYHSGEVSYIQNVRPIQRSKDQREEIKVVITF